MAFSIGLQWCSRFTMLLDEPERKHLVSYMRNLRRTAQDALIQMMHDNARRRGPTRRGPPPPVNWTTHRAPWTTAHRSWSRKPSIRPPCEPSSASPPSLRPSCVRCGTPFDSFGVAYWRTPSPVHVARGGTNATCLRHSEPGRYRIRVSEVLRRPQTGNREWQERVTTALLKENRAIAVSASDGAQRTSRILGRR